MIKVEALKHDQIENVMEDVARLRIAVFRDWPYLYDGDLQYEQTYLEPYQTSEKAIVVGAYDGTWLVGASTGAPLTEHVSGFSEAFDGSDLDLSKVYYCGESVLLKPYRGRGIGKKFFDLREARARELGFEHICFCSVLRSPSHPLFPSAYRPLDDFWKSRGYSPLAGVQAHFSWKDIDQDTKTRKPLQFWMRKPLGPQQFSD